MWLSVDPLAEQFPGWTPYHYVHNNPVNMVDPTGMAAEGWRTDNETGERKFDESFTRENTPSTHTYDNAILDGKNQLFYDESGGITPTGTVMENVSITKASSMHPYFSATPSGEYGPYIPDGVGLTVGGAIGGFTASLSGVADKKNNIGLFGSFDGSFSIHNIFAKPFSLSMTLDHYDNNSKTGNLLDKIAGESRTISASYGVYGVFSYPVDSDGNRDTKGVTKTSFGLGSPSVGFGGGKTFKIFGK